MNADIPALLIQLLLIAGAMVMLRLAARRHARAAPGDAGAPVSRIRGAARVVEVGIWFGLTTGVLQLLLAFANRFVRGNILFQSPHTIWMTPLAYVVIFAAIGVAGAGLYLVLPRLAPVRVVAGAYAWLGTFALLIPFFKLHPVSSALIAAGVAVQVARMMSGDRAPWMATLRRGGLALAGTVAAVLVGVFATGVVRERLALRSLPPPPTGASNVLVLILDTVRASNLRLYGYHRNTAPELDRYAAEGVTFDQAMSTAPWTLMSHASMFTGLYPYEIEGGFGRPVRTAAPMLAELFRDRGYVTGGFVANLIYGTRETGLAKGFIHYDDYHPTRAQVLSHSWIAQTPLFKQLVASRSLGDLARAVFSLDTRVFAPGFNMRTYERRPAAEITEAFLVWRDTAGDRPYFAFLNFFDAHLPYQAPARLVARVTGSDAKPSAEDRYDASIARVDEAIGMLLEDLRARGELDNTIVVITSDHGEQFGEHGLVEHGNSLYTHVLRVPLVLRYPARVPGNLVVDTPVTLRDLAATITDLAGLGEGAAVPGASLAAYWARDTGAVQGSAIIAHLGPRIRPPVDEPTFFGPMIAAFDETFHYIRRGDGAEQLFAYRTDPAEEHDLAATAEGARVLPRFRAMVPAP